MPFLTIKQISARFVITVPLLLSAGCVVHLDRPAAISVHGFVVCHDSGAPVPGAYVVIVSGRRSISTPGMARVPAGRAITDDHGRFELEVRNVWPSDVYAYTSKPSGFGKTLVDAGSTGSILVRIAPAVAIVFPDPQSRRCRLPRR